MSPRNLIILTIIAGAGLCFSQAIPAPVKTEKTIKPAPLPKVELTKEETAKIETPPDRTILLDCPLIGALQAALRREAEKNGVPYAIALAVAEQESSFRINAVNDGSYGLMQIHQVHAPAEVLLDPFENIKYGCYLLGIYHQKYGDWHKALIVYNCGEAGAHRWYFNDGITTSEYSRQVMLRAAKWRERLE